MIVIKWGGSLLTNKGSSGPARFRTQAARRLARAVAAARIKGGAIIVHGAGSFGHPLALKHGIGRRRLRGRALQEALVAIRPPLDELQGRVVRAARQEGLPVVAMPAFPVYRMGLPAAPFDDALRHGLVPVTGGDVVLDRSLGLRILSGDEILYSLAHDLAPRRVIYATDAPGVVVGDHLMTELPRKAARAVQRRLSAGRDATGGMAGKLAWARKVQAVGVEVWIIDGRDAATVEGACRGRDVVGTRLPP